MAEPTPETSRRASLKSAEVCEIIHVQPYVLRSWEKEFPDLGTSRTEGGPRFYRQGDLDRVTRLKQLVFGEGLTLAGARRRLDEERGNRDAELPFEDPATISPEARHTLDEVRSGLRSILELLSASRPMPAMLESVAPGDERGETMPELRAAETDAAPKRTRRRRQAVTG